MLNKVCLLVLLLACLLLVKGYSKEDAEVVFTGIPALKISEGGVERVVEDINEDKASEFKCVITKKGDKYFWASRNNVELNRIQSGAFLTFIATSGVGYVRIISPELKDTAALMSETEEKYDYVEHMLIGLRAVTYYGKPK